MDNQFSRTTLLFGYENMKKLAEARVAVFGIGGVGGYTAEALVRSGIGAIDIIDNDKISISNLNRQIFALNSTLGQYKVDAAQKRLNDINPLCKIVKHNVFFTPDCSSSFDLSKYSYAADCIDTITGKIEIILQSKKADIPVISCMGAGNKINPALFEVTDIYKTSVCPLARVMRHELKKRGVKDLKVVSSTEKAKKILDSDFEHMKTQELLNKKIIPASNSFVPSVAGLIIAGEIIKDIIGLN